MRIIKKYFVFTAIMLLFSVAAVAQNVSNLKASFIDCKAVVSFDFTASSDTSGTPLSLKYSGDNGVTWLPCVTVSGDTGVQTVSGRKTIVWDCLADGTGYGVILKFDIDYPHDCEDVIYTVTGNGKVINFKMVCVKGGSFLMGCTDEQDDDGGSCFSDMLPVHNVLLSNDYYTGETEVTQGLWLAVMGGWPDPSYFNPDLGYGYYGRSDSNPMYYVSRINIVGTAGDKYTINSVDYYADGFCYKLSVKVNEYSGGSGLGVWRFRLPTEAEWEYAARGGHKATEQYIYSGSNTIGDVAWYMGNNNIRTIPVKQLSANVLGLYDMSGNVSEWCSDWYDANYYYDASSGTNPTGPSLVVYPPPAPQPFCVIRGGGWDNSVAGCRVAYRDSYTPSYRYINVGFRLAISFTP
jgi:formylglycine-generating enzyme required for sulfatase activity